MNPSASRCFICGCKTVVNDEKHLPMFVVTKARLPKWEKVLPQEGLKVGVKLCGDHFDDGDISKEKLCLEIFMLTKGTDWLLVLCPNITLVILGFIVIHPSHYCLCYMSFFLSRVFRCIQRSRA